MNALTVFAVPLLYSEPPLVPVVLQVLRVTKGRLTAFCSPDFHVLLSDGQYKTCVFVQGEPSSDLCVGALVRVDSVKAMRGEYMNSQFLQLEACLTVVAGPYPAQDAVMWGYSQSSSLEEQWKLQLLHCLRLLTSQLPDPQQATK